MKTFENFNNEKIGFFADYDDNKKNVSTVAAIDGYGFYESELEFVKFLVTIKEGKLSVSMDDEFRVDFSDRKIKMYENEILDELNYSVKGHVFFDPNIRFGYGGSYELYLYYEDGTKV
jgi:hypothetical protein